MGKLLPLDVLGKGTLEIECLSSYLIRLSYTHGVSINHLFEYMYSHLEEYKGKKLPRFTGRGNLAVYVRPTKVTDEVVHAIEGVAGDVGLRSTTFLALSEALGRTSGLFAKHLRWCPECFKEAYEKNESPYYKLTWQINDISHCHIHYIGLIDRCPHCNKNQDSYGIRKELGVCHFCGERLSEVKTVDRGNSWDGYGNDLISVVEEIAGSESLEFPEGGVKKVVCKIFDDMWKQGKEQELYDVIPRKECFTIIDELKPMTLIVARRVAYRLGLDLCALLEGDTKNIQIYMNNEWNSSYPSAIRPKNKIKIHNKEEVYKRVLEIIYVYKDDMSLSFRAVAKKLGVSEGYLKHNFRYESDKIKCLHKEWKENQKQVNSVIGYKAATEIFKKSINANGGVTRKEVLRILRKETGLPLNFLEVQVNRAYEELFKVSTYQ